MKFKKIFVIDLDNTLCKTPKENGFYQYKKATPLRERINEVNFLYNSGNKIIIDTARGCNSGFDWHQFTESQLKDWGLKYHILRTGLKFGGDIYIDDKATNPEDFFTCQ